MTTCKIDGCEKAISSRGWCPTHYSRWRRTGDPGGASIQKHFSTPDEALSARTERRGECLIWTGYVKPDGYGRMWTTSGLVYVHRFAWERVNGPVPEGMVLDHKDHCSTSCVEVSHLRLATVAENSSNRNGAPNNRSTGVRNVYLEDGAYKVVVGERYFGRFASIAEAAATAERVRREIYGEFAGKGRAA